MTSTRQKSTRSTQRSLFSGMPGHADVIANLRRAASVLVAIVASIVGLPAPASASVVVQIVSQSYYVDGAGYLNIVGEVVNNGTENVRFVELDFNLYSDSGVLLDTDFTFTDADILAPGEKSGFHEMVDPPAGYHHYTINGPFADATTAKPNHNFSARVTNRFTQYGYENIVGEVTNNNLTTSNFVAVMFTFYGPTGAVVDADFTFVDTSDASLGGGATGTFKLMRGPSDPAYSSYALLVESSTPPSYPASPPDAPASPQPQVEARQGYWMIGRMGDVYAFGNAAQFGSPPRPGTGVEYVDLEPTPTGSGYWIVDNVGHVYTQGDAGYFGGVPALARAEAITSLSRTASGRGYWLFSNLGRVYSYGDAVHFGDMGGTRLNGPVLDSIPTPTGRGYYMVASDGGIFSFGDATFRGSMGAVRLNAPVQSLVPDSDGVGYWLVASDGGIFAFDALFHGSMGSVRLSRPVTGMVGFGNGYLMVGEDGGIFSFGDAPFFGSLGANPPAQPIVSVAVLNQ